MARGWAWKPNGYLLVTVASWGLNFVALKEVYRQVSPPSLALLRYLVMWAALVGVCLWRRESLRLPRADAARLLWLGFLSMGVYMLLFLEGMRGTSPTEGAILLQMSPVFTALLAASLGIEVFSWWALAGAGVAFAGTGLILYAPGPHDSKLLPNLMVVASAAVWAYAIVVMQPLLNRYSPLRVLTLSMGGGLPIMLIYGLRPALSEPWGQVNSWGWLMFVHVAVISGVVAFICFYEGVRQIGPSSATLYQYLVPPTAMLFAMLLNRQLPTAPQILGLLIVLAGVAYASAARPPPAAVPAEL